MDTRLSGRKFFVRPDGEAIGTSYSGCAPIHPVESSSSDARADQPRDAAHAWSEGMGRMRDDDYGNTVMLISFCDMREGCQNRDSKANAFLKKDSF